MPDLEVTSPYNFVKLNRAVLQPPLAEKMPQNSDFKDKECQELLRAEYKQYMLQGKKYSGYFEVELENLTPLYIAGKDGFFSDGKNLLIPGSSLRGCLKNIFKIITNGCMRIGNNEDLTERRFYYRDFSKHNLSVRYRENMQGVRAGFLVKYAGKYYICPAEYEAESLHRDDHSGYSVKWLDNGVEIHTGFMFRKKKYYVLTNPDWHTRLALSDECIKLYKGDVDRAAEGDNGGNLLESCYARSCSKNPNIGILEGSESYSYVMPCFYVADAKGVKHFGSGLNYRIPFAKTIGDHIPKYLKADTVDFADAVFGMKELWGSRVFFEDLYLEEENDNLLCPKAKMKPLLGPKAKSFQNYLEYDKKGKSMHWDENSLLRGYKLYWHKKSNWEDNTNYKQSNKKENKNISQAIQPLKENKRFYGKIRFENLDNVELGALAKLFVIGEGKDSCYKLGMGKPLGMGSVKIKAKLYLRNDEYYRSFTASGMNQGDYNRFAKDFDDYLGKELPKDELTLYKARMDELSIIMDYSLQRKANWEEMTQYIDATDKYNRTKLIGPRIAMPTIEDVYNSLGKKK